MSTLFIFKNQGNFIKRIYQIRFSLFFDSKKLSFSNFSENFKKKSFYFDNFITQEEEDKENILKRAIDLKNRNARVPKKV